MFKNVIVPIQTWLLSQGKCVGCGMPLDKGKKKKRKDGTVQVTCKCRRVFIYNIQTKKYRRALLDEI